MAVVNTFTLMPATPVVCYRVKLKHINKEKQITYLCYTDREVRSLPQSRSIFFGHNL